MDVYEALYTTRAMRRVRPDPVPEAVQAKILCNSETLRILGVPADHGWEMVCCVSFGYPTGRWGIAPRRPAHEVAYRHTWGSDLALEIPDPLWPPPAA